MSPERVRAAILDAIRRVAPDVEVDALDPGADLRRQADLDSVDVVNIVTRLREALGVDVPEADYGALSTLDEAVAYLTRRLEEN